MLRQERTMQSPGSLKVGFLLTLLLFLFSLVVEAETTEDRCQNGKYTCSGKPDVPCRVRMLPYPCFLPETDHRDFPSPPRNLTANRHKVNNNSWVISMTWKLPYDSSYKAVRGFQLTVNSVTPQHHGSQLRCFFFNMSHANWTSVSDVHSTMFHFDCLQYTNTTSTTIIFLTLYSIPKPTHGSTPVTVRVTLPRVAEKMIPLWQPQINTQAANGMISVNFHPPFPKAAYHMVCIRDIRWFICEQEKRVNQTVTDVLFTRIPGNRTYEAWVKPFSGDGGWLDQWVTSKEFFLAQGENIVATDTTQQVILPPEVPTTPLSTSSPEEKFHNEQDSINMAMIILIVVISLLFASVSVFIIVKVWKYLRRRNALPPCNHSPVPNNMRGIYVDSAFPIYYPISEAYKTCVETLLKLLQEYGGIDVHSYCEGRKSAMEDVPKWVDEQMKNCKFLVFQSESLDTLYKNRRLPNEHPYGSICLKAFDKLKELNDCGQEIVTIQVNFGFEEEGDLQGFQLPMGLHGPVLRLSEKTKTGWKLVNFEQVVDSLLGWKECPSRTPLLVPKTWKRSREAQQLKKNLARISQVKTDRLQNGHFGGDHDIYRRESYPQGSFSNEHVPQETSLTPDSPVTNHSNSLHTSGYNSHSQSNGSTSVNINTDYSPACCQVSLGMSSPIGENIQPHVGAHHHPWPIHVNYSNFCAPEPVHSTNVSESDLMVCLQSINMKST